MPAEKIAGKKSHAGHAKKTGEGKEKHAGQETGKEKEKHAEHEAKKAQAEKERLEQPGVKKAEGGKEKNAEMARQEAELKKGPKIAKSRQVKRLSRLVRAKRRFLFRGRFGKRSVRKVSKKKWQKWRQPRGIDIYFYREDGLVPGTGYKVAREIRFVHPSGYRESLVRNMRELASLEKEKGSVAARISHAVGKKKKTGLLRKADELGIVVLNR